MECVYIEWDDASAVDPAGWVERASAKPSKPHVFRQVGFVTGIDLDAVTLTEAYSHTNTSPRVRIPLGMIRRWVYLDTYLKAD